MSKIQFAEAFRVDCRLPIDAVKARTDLQKRLGKSAAKTKPVVDVDQLNMNDATALGKFLFQG